MNELSIEEKAKAYDEVIEKLRDFYRNYDTVSHLIDVKEELANLIPELKEIEDERIRKELIEQVTYIVPNKNEVDDNGNTLPCYTTRINKYIAWLEKQCKNNMGISEATKKKLEDNLNKALEKETTESWNEFLENQDEQKIIVEIAKEICKDKTSAMTFLKSTGIINDKGELAEQYRQDEQKPEMIFLKFREGDRVTNGDDIYAIDSIDKNCYWVKEHDCIAIPFEYQHHWELVEQKPTDKVEPKFKVKYAGSEYNVLDVKDVAGITYYGIEDEPNHIDFVLSNNCEIVSEQNPVNKVKPKFKVGDYVVGKYISGYISEIRDDCYLLDYQGFSIDKQDKYHLWTIKDAKDGDILRIRNLTFIFQEITNNNTSHKNAATAYCSYEDNDDSFGVSGPDCITDLELITPATKEQRDILMKAMTAAGYTFDFEKKELKKINEEIEEINAKDYGIDGLYHAQRILEKTLGKVNGYQTDDGILDHKAAITTIRKLYEQKLDWDEDDARNLNSILSCIKHCQDEDVEAQYNGNRNVDPKHYDSLKCWLKFLKNRIQSQNFTVTDTELIKAKKDAYNDALNKIEYHSDTPTFDDGWSAAIDYIRKKYIK